MESTLLRNIASPASRVETRRTRGHKGRLGAGNEGVVAAAPFMASLFSGNDLLATARSTVGGQSHGAAATAWLCRCFAASRTSRTAFHRAPPANHTGRPGTGPNRSD